MCDDAFCSASYRCPSANGCDALLDFSTFSASDAREWTSSPVGAPFSDWAHVAVTVNKQGRVRTYVNGRLTRERETPLTSAFLYADGTSTPDNYIGGTRWFDLYQDFDGRIDDFEVWDGELTPEQIYALYDGPTLPT